MRDKVHMVRTPESKTTAEDGEFYGPVLCSSSRGGYGRPLPRIRTNRAETVTCKACLKKLVAAPGLRLQALIAVDWKPWYEAGACRWQGPDAPPRTCCKCRTPMYCPNYAGKEVSRSSTPQGPAHDAGHSVPVPDETV